MKKIFLIFSILILLPTISSIEFTIEEEYDQGETLMAKVSGSFIDTILPENIYFYRGHVRVPFLYDVAKINDEYYIYALLPETQNDYSIVIKNTQYRKGTAVTDDDIQRNFSITDKKADFSINPGFVVAKQGEEFLVKIQNLQDTSITVNSKFGTIESPATLKSGEIKKFVLKTGDTSIKNLELSTSNLKYDVPVHIVANDTEAEEKQEYEFRLSPSELNISSATNSEKTITLYLYNTGQETLEDIELKLSGEITDYAELSKTKIQELGDGDKTTIELEISSDEEGYFEGQLSARSDQDSDYIPIYLNFLEDYTPPEDDGEDTGPPEEYEPTTFQTCAELDGKFCEENQECETDTTDAKDGVCCLSDCKEKTTSSTGKIIGWTIIILVVIVLFWFFKSKYKKASKPVDLLERGKRKAKR